MIIYDYIIYVCKYAVLWSENRQRPPPQWVAAAPTSNQKDENATMMLWQFPDIME